MADILKLFRKHNLLGRNGPQISRIDQLSLSKIVDIATEIDNTVKKNQLPANNPIFSHSASLHLGGDSTECCYSGCRMLRINKLARFALMYSDKVYIASFFSKYKYVESKNDPLLCKVKEDLYNDLLVINEIVPLLQDGLIGLFAPEIDVCFACQATKFLGEGAGKRFNIEYSKLQKTYLEKIEVICEKADDEHYYYKLIGQPEYLGHSANFRILNAKNSPFLTYKPKLKAALDEGKPIALPKNLVKELGFHEDKAHMIATNAINGLVTSKCLNTSFLTENELHISFLNSLHELPAVRQQNDIAAKYLTSIVPFVEDVKLADIVKLRRREKEAFVNYRLSLNSAIGEFIKSGEQFTVKDAQALYADVIAPSLASLDKKVKLAKKDLMHKPFRSLAGLVGSISFGVLTGLISPDISAVAKAIGLIGFGGKFIGDVMALGDSEDKIANEHFYFLWKIRKKIHK